MALVGCGRIGFDPVGDGDSGALGRWALIQTAGVTSSNVRVAPLGAHHLVAVAAGDYQAQWDQPDSGAYCSAAAAFRIAP
jgi:hypothetical protein